ncbi:MAG: UDP-3-O-(3-hydroxymyristoyl)glucosamine N-acyltransferase, partial [Nitrospinae bacterium CG11_big_fil_rev_8_21_14_0_20_56_8]
MKKTLGELADLVGGEVVGDAQVAITGISGIEEASAGDLTFVANARYANLAQDTRASAIIASPDIKLSGKTPAIRSANPSLAFARIASIFHDTAPLYFQGIHPSAVIAPEAVIGRNVTVGPLTVIEGGARIGDDTVIFGQCYIARDTELGQGCVLYPQVTVRERVTIGNRVVIHNGTVIGSDGFGYVQVDGIHEKIPQIGIVDIHDDVEIGANVTIDRARFKSTVIG